MSRNGTIASRSVGLSVYPSARRLSGAPSHSSSQTALNSQSKPVAFVSEGFVGVWTNDADIAEGTSSRSALAHATHAAHAHTAHTFASARLTLCVRSEALSGRVPVDKWVEAYWILGIVDIFGHFSSNLTLKSGYFGPNIVVRPYGSLFV
jgi:hypothetical protein